MRSGFIQNQRLGRRSLLSFVIVGAFLLTIAASHVPGLHERIHADQGPLHTCAVTILSTGSVEICGSSAIVPAPCATPKLRLFDPVSAPEIFGALDFLLLEHAPPAVS